MNFKFGFHLIVCVLVIHCIEGTGKNKEKCKVQTDDREKGLIAQQSDVRPHYIKQFSESLKFLVSFFSVIQRQLNDTITTFNPNRPNPLFSMVLANPSLIPIALRRLRDPIAEMLTITTKIEKILLTNDPKQLENNNELQRLLQQFQRRLHSLFGPLMPNNNLLTRMPLTTSFPDMVKNLSDWVTQLAGMLAIVSQTVRDVANVGPNSNPINSSPTNTNPNQWLMNNRSDTDLQTKADELCSQLQDIVLASREAPGNSTGLVHRQLLPVVIDLLGSVLGGVNTALGGALGSVVTLLASVVSAATTLVGVGGYVSTDPGTLRNTTVVIPLSNRTVDDLQLFTFGVIDSQNKLIITNIVTKENVEIASFNQDQIHNNQSLISRMSLNSLNSLMISIANDLNSISEPKFMSSLKCQLEGFDCSIRNRDNYPEVQTCLKTLLTCIGTAI